MGEVAEGAKTGRRTRSWRRRLSALYATIAFAVLLFGYNMIANVLVYRHDAQAGRDPATEILRGAEALDLGPQDAAGAVLFVHGFCGSANNFHMLPQQVADAGWRVRVMRLSGHGTTPRDFERTNADALLDGVLDELRELKRRYARVVVVGHSMGGALATLATAREPVDGLVLASPYFSITHRWYYVLTAERWTKLTSPVLRWVYRPVNVRPVKRKEARAQIVAYSWIPTRGALTAFEVARRANEPAVLGRISFPLLLVHAKDDTVTSLKASARAFEAISSPEKEAVWLENSNHVIFWDYDREFVTSKVIEFLEGLPVAEADL